MLAAFAALALFAAQDGAPVSPAAAPPAAAAAATAKPDDDPMICRSETPIGARIPKRSCIRKSERDRQKRDSQDALQLLQHRSDGPSVERK